MAGWIKKATSKPGTEKRRAKADGVSTHTRFEKSTPPASPSARGHGDLHKAAAYRYRNRSA